MAIEISVADVSFDRDPLFTINYERHHVASSPRLLSLDRRCFYSGALLDMQSSVQSAHLQLGETVTVRFSLKGRRRFRSFLKFLASIKGGQHWAHDLFEWLRNPPSHALPEDWKEPVVEFKFEKPLGYGISF